MYTTRNFKTKKELKAAVDAWNAESKEPVKYFQPGPFGTYGPFGAEPSDGKVYIEGPHFPQPHRWYAECEVRRGVIVKVK